MVSEKMIGDKRYIGALDRGIDSIAIIMSDDSFIDEDKVVKITKMPKSIIRVWRSQNTVLYFQKSSEIKYPKWQFHSEYGVVHKGIREIIALSGNCHVTAYRLLMEVMPDGSDEAVHKKLEDGHTQQVLDHLKSIVSGSIT